MPGARVSVTAAVFLVALAWLLTACGGGASNGASPAATGTAALTPPLITSPTPVRTAAPKNVTPGERATFYGADAGDHGGVVAVGDFNGDTAPDLALGASVGAGPDGSRPEAGEVYVFFGPFSPGQTRDAALGEQDVTVYGADAGDQAGRALAAGDVNADGTDDLVVGAPFGDGPDNSRPDSGEAAIVLGSRSLPSVIDLRAAADATLYGAEKEDLLGLAVAAADVNGDAVADVIASAIWADGPDNGRDRAGEVYVVFGSSGLRPVVDIGRSEQDVTVYGARADDRLGESLAAGDVNGDANPDMVVPASFARRAAGETYVIAGGGSIHPVVDLADGGAVRAALGFDEGDQLGHSLAVGDVDGDGFGDVLLGAVSADGPDNRRDLAGEALLVPGKEIVAQRGVGGGRARFFGAAAEDRLGRAVALGDLNADRLADLLMAAPGAAGAGEGHDDAGNVYVFFRPVGLPETIDMAAAAADLTLAGDDGGDILGDTVYGKPSVLVADMDGDGLNDIVVSAPGGDGPANHRADAGEAYIVFMTER